MNDPFAPPKDEEVPGKLRTLQNILGKFRNNYAAWATGIWKWQNAYMTDKRLRNQYDQIADLRELTMMLRVEVNGLTFIINKVLNVPDLVIMRVFMDEIGHCIGNEMEKWAGLAWNEQGLFVIDQEKWRITQKKYNLPDLPPIGAGKKQ